MLLAENLKNSDCIGHDYELNVLLVLATSWSTTIQGCVWLISVEHFALLQGQAMKKPAWKKLDRKKRQRPKSQIRWRPLWPSRRDMRQWHLGCFGCPMGHLMVTFWLATKVTSIQELQNWRFCEAIIKHTAEFRIPCGKGWFFGWLEDFGILKFCGSLGQIEL